jgi:hypothetical protein
LGTGESSKEGGKRMIMHAAIAAIPAAKVQKMG